MIIDENSHWQKNSEVHFLDVKLGAGLRLGSSVVCQDSGLGRRYRVGLWGVSRGLWELF